MNVNNRTKKPSVGGVGELMDAQRFGPVDAAALVKRLQRPAHPVDVVLDTDAYNEIDDQYAIAYLLLHQEKLHTQALYAAPFSNARADSPAEGMQKSHEEILHILALMHMPALKNQVFQGAEAYLPDEFTPVHSPAAADLSVRAMRYSPEHPLYVVAIGAITNIASALLMNPEIRDRIVIIWLGGHAFHWHDNREFNMRQDIAAARVVLGCGAAVVLLPCRGVVSSFTTSESELRKYLLGKNALCDYLYNVTCKTARGESKIACWTRPIWDVAAVAYLLDARYMLERTVSAPIPEYDGYWAFDRSRHFIQYVYHINRDCLFEDLFERLGAFTMP